MSLVNFYSKLVKYSKKEIKGNAPKIMIEYIRKGEFKEKNGKVKFVGKRIKKGVMVAVPCNNREVRIGWSLCNFSAGDEFTDRGLAIAINRAKMGRYSEIPESVVCRVDKFIARAERYYKDKKVVLNGMQPAT